MTDPAVYAALAVIVINTAKTHPARSEFLMATILVVLAVVSCIEKVSKFFGWL